MAAPAVAPVPVAARVTLDEFYRDRVRHPRPRGRCAVAPDLAVEVLSDSDRRAVLAAKVADYLGAGSRLARVLDPDARTAVVRAPGRPSRTVAAGGALEGEDVLPGLVLPLAELFGALDVPA
jgi:Uma2 family endonuclease